jgi:hypothetical protein
LQRMCAPLLAARAAAAACTADRAFAALDCIPRSLQSTLPVLLCRARLYYDAGVHSEVRGVSRRGAIQMRWTGITRVRMYRMLHAVVGGRHGTSFDNFVAYAKYA